MSYIIVSVDKSSINKCYDFSEKIIKQKDQFDRMLPSYAKDFETKEKIRIMRTFVGKLGEVCFSKYLSNKGIMHNTEGMFDILNGEQNVDEFDFMTRDGKKIDIKTAVFSNHSRLVVPLDQFLHMKKDYYVGMKLDIDSAVKKYEDIDKYKIEKAFIWGFSTYEKLAAQPTGNLGEFDCKYVSSTQLTDIAQLINKI